MVALGVRMSLTNIVFWTELVSVSNAQRHDWWALAIENIMALPFVRQHTYLLAYDFQRIYAS